MSGKTAIILSHADYHRSEYMFARQQSRVLASLEWESREKPLRSWAQILPAALGIAAAAIALLQAIH